MDHEDIVELLLSRGARLEVAIDDAVRMGDEVIMEKMLALRPVFRRYERSCQQWRMR
jgi:predicted KAP-like P-loop ATPase